MSSWVSFGEALKKLDIKHTQILSLIKKGLQPYSHHGIPIHCPKYLHETTTKEQALSRIEGELSLLEPVHNLKDEADRFKGKPISVYCSLGKNIWDLERYLSEFKESEIDKTNIDADETIFANFNLSFASPVFEGGLTTYVQQRINQEIVFTNGERAFIENRISALLNEKNRITDELANIRKDDPRNTSWKYFILPTTDEGVERIIDLLKNKGASFKRDDFLKFENGVSVQLPPQNDLPATLRKNETPKSSPETFIKNLKIYYESDNEIKIQQPGKKAKSVTCDTLGFKNNQTKAWTALLNILQDPDHIYKLGRAYTISAGLKVSNKEYEQKRKRLEQISLKLVKYFNKDYSVAIPENYKLFERAKDKGPGKYRPIFSTATNSDREKSPLENKYEKLSKDELVKEIKNNVKEYSDSNDQAGMEKMTVALIVAKDKNLLTDQEIRDLIEPKSDKEYIQENFSDIRYMINMKMKKTE